ncbi:MAG: transposase [Fusobacteriaceae bacterium]
MIVEYSKEIINYFSDLNLNFSKPQTAHLLDFVSAIINIDAKKTVSGISRNISRDVHRCNRTRFLNNSPFDDTLIVKNKDRKHIEGLSFQFSHVTGKSEFSHSQVAMNALTGNLSLPLDLKMYLSKDYCQKKNLKFKSKPDLALELIESLNFTKDNQTYLLMDRWYASKNLIMEALRLGIHTIVPLKSSRLIFPDGIQHNIKLFAENLQKSELNLVTVSGKDYYTYRYEGHLKGIERFWEIIYLAPATLQ